MRRLFLSVIAASMLMVACKQAATKSATDSVKVSTNTPTPANPVSPTTVAGPVQADGPAMKFEFDTHDFGKITEGDKVTYKFNFANTGKSPLIITNAVASCGCTIPTWPKAPIKPGEGGQIVVTFNSLGKKGLQDKMVTITANTNPAQNVVHLVGEVLEKK